MALGVAGVHAEELAREERSLLAAGAGANFEQDVFVVVGIARRQQQLERSSSSAWRFCSVGQIGLGQFAQLGVVALEKRAMLGDLVECAAILAIAPTTSVSCAAFAGELRIFAIVAR